MRTSLVLAGLVTMVVGSLPMTTLAADPDASPIAPPALSPPPIMVMPSDTVTWAPIEGPFGTTVPGISVEAAAPIAWAGGFAAVERSTSYGLDDQGDATVTWDGPAVWVSVDGASWTRAKAPTGSIEPTLLAWRDGLALVETERIRGTGRRRAGFNDWRFRIWTSTDGRHWQRHGGLTLRPEGDLRQCALYDPFPVTAGDRLVIATSCVRQLGAGGAVDPGSGHVGMAQRAKPATIPVFAWSSQDGHRWTRRLVTYIRHRGATFVGFRTVPGGATVSLEKPRRIRWTRDGRRWVDIGPLPRDGDVRWFGAWPLDPAGTRWIGVGQPGAVDPDPSGGLNPEPDHRTIWLRDGHEPWRELAGEEGWENLSVAIDGSTVVVGIQETLDLRARSVLAYRLLVSRDSGSTWVDVTTPVDLPAGYCDVTLHASDLLLRCIGQDDDIAVAYLRADLRAIEEPAPAS